MSKLISVLLTDEVFKMLEENRKKQPRNALINEILKNHFLKEETNKNMLESHEARIKELETFYNNLKSIFCKETEEPKENTAKISKELEEFSIEDDDDFFMDDID